MNELIRLSKKAANEWRNTDAYYQAAVLIDSLCERLEKIENRNPQTNADRIRAMSDEQLKYIARAVIESLDCLMGETECTECVFHDLCVRGEYYYNNEEEWLQQPAEQKVIKNYKKVVDK